MKKIGFLGAYDKTDMLLYIAKVLTAMEKKVLLIDSTITQKAKYIVPVINPTRAYLTEFEEIDVAVGFKSFDDMNGYLGIDNEQQLNYDIALIDVDTSSSFEGFNLEEASLNFFVTSFDLYSLRKGLEIFAGLNQEIELIKILFSRRVLKEDEQYLDYLSANYKIKWSENKLFLPLEVGDQSVMIENQRVEKIKLKNMSSQFKDSLMMIADLILENANPVELKKTLRRIEKGV